MIKPYMTIVGGICFNLFTGNIMSWGNIANYVISYYHYLGDKNATNKMGLSIMPIAMIVCTCFYSGGTYMMKWYNIKLIMIGLSAMMLLSVFVLSYV